MSKAPVLEPSNQVLLFQNYIEMKKLIVLLSIVSLTVTKSHIQAQTSIPFNCDYSAYLFQYNDVYALDLASGSSYLVKADVTPGNVNGAGYNPSDGYIWGYLSAPSSTIVRIGQNFTVDVYTIPNLPSGNKYVGDIDSNGIYYCKSGGTSYYKIDINPNSSSYLNYLGVFTLSQSLSIADWAFNAVDGQLYTVEGSSGKLFRINPVNGFVTNLGTVPSLQGLSYTYGAVYFDASGRFYVSANQTGTVYVIQNVQNLTPSSGMVSNTFCFGPAASSNDGARCPTAPVPQEDCLNGIDDDGDGLVDCDDPSCSGIATCPVIAPPVVGGNQGGLESNRRLSQQINQRNFLRKKSSYQFNVKHAPAFTPALSKNGDDINLSQLIPKNSILGASAIESSALDLINITNAAELLSVDYIKDEKTLAVILATRTEKKVYEHTKYICDRLLGSELLSVSTITINEQQFIRSIIKNNDGSKEFVISFSAFVNDNEEAEIESHWNLDKYPTGKDYFNFQIWTNQIDDLVRITTDVLELLNAKKSIVNYSLSTPPPVFVRKGAYRKGKLSLEIINNNLSETLNVNAGVKRTETSELETISNSFDISKNLLNAVEINTGKLFDIGFRLDNGTDATPDDLFLSDGPWGLDVDENTSTVSSFIVSENEESNHDGFAVERTATVEAMTSSYFSLYRAFTPRFKSVDLSGDNTLEFEATGTGDLEITIIKEGIENWEKQFKTSIHLQATNNHYYIPLAHFTSTTGEVIDLSDAVSIVFTMASDGKKTVQKKLSLGEMLFSYQETMMPAGLLANQKVILTPNPMQGQGTVHFSLQAAEKCSLAIYNLAGNILMEQEMKGLEGINTKSFDVSNLQKGMYLLQIQGENTRFEMQKLVLE